MTNGIIQTISNYYRNQTNINYAVE